MCYHPTPKLSPHRRLCIYTFSKKPHSVWFISVLKSGDMGQCPHKSPSPCNTCHTCVIIQIYVLICHKNARTHTHTHVHTHTHTRHILHFIAMCLWNTAIYGYVQNIPKSFVLQREAFIAETLLLNISRFSERIPSYV